MRAEFSVTDDDIAYAEGVLLPRGELFDEERRSFIRDLGTLDLQAVPGSGKTTALLAKLLILDRYLPFADGSPLMTNIRCSFRLGSRPRQASLESSAGI